MKNLKFLSMMLMLMVGLVSFTACSSDDDDKNSPAGTDSQGNPSIVGTWKFDSTQEEELDDVLDYDYVETLNFANNGTGSVKGTIKGKGYSSSYEATFIYVLSWKDGVGTLRITDMKGETGLLSAKVYYLNGNNSDLLTNKLLRLDYIPYRR